MLPADDVIRRLGLAPHPEGGHYRETFRDGAVNVDGRAASSAIYFLLRAGEASRWHRIDAVEVWHWYAGASLELTVRSPVESQYRLGNALELGELPQAVVPANAWQRARSLGDWSLVGCTVAPAFRFETFELLAPGLADPE
jgi:predicted cupin superfamily sugar epimerase